MSKTIQALEAAQHARARSLATSGGVSNRMTIAAAILAVFVIGGGTTWWLSGHGERKAQSMYREGLYLLTGDDVEDGYARLEAVADTYPESTWAEDALWVIAQSRQSAGEQKDARATYIRLLSNYPESPLAGEARKQLEQLGGVPPIIRREEFAKRSDATLEGAISATSVQTASASVSGGQTYTVKSGDTLGRIAQEFGTTVKWIQQANNLTSDRIFPDQELVITRQLLQ